MTLLWCSSKFAQLYKLSLCNWRASEASETLSGVTQSRFRYIYLFIYLFIYMVRRTTFSARASNRKEGGVKFQSFLKQLPLETDTKNNFHGKRVLPVS